MTKHNVALLRLFQADPTREWYGLEVADALRMKSGVLYPGLHRLHAAGIVTRTDEDVDPAEVGRPRRRLYRLTAQGATFAREQLGEAPAAAPEPARKPVSRQPRTTPTPAR
jgi:PadR family transcriptional regulator PadR